MTTISEIVIDFSGSMSNSNKISFAKELLKNEIIPAIDFSMKIGVKTFCSQNNAPKIETILPLSFTDTEQLIDAINKIGKPDGGTPIAAAIRNSVDSLKEYSAYEKRIILITDGQETDGGDYELEAEEAKKEGIECQIHIIGLGLKNTAVQKAERISNITGGSFSNLAIDNTNTAKTAKTSLQNFISKIGVEMKTISTAELAPETNLLKQQNNSVELKQGIESIKGDESIEVSKSNNKEKKEDHEIESNQHIIRLNENSEILKDIVNQIRLLNEKIDLLAEENVEIYENEELNEKIRLVSEEFVFNELKLKYGERVRWMNEKGESYSHHDFEILETEDVVEYYIECKGTIGSDKIFFMTKNEWRLFLNNTKNYQVYFITNALDNPHLIKIDNLLDWIKKGKVVPYTNKNLKLKADRVLLKVNDI